MNRETRKRRIGIVGFGRLGQYLVQAIQKSDDAELAFVWNRSPESLKEQIDVKYILDDLSQFPAKNADLIVEVSHPVITVQYGEQFLQHADYMVGSPTCFAEQEVENKLRSAAKHHGMYIPSGAFWGGNDIKKMADRGTLKGLRVTMKKHPNSFKVLGELKVKNDSVTDSLVVIYDGPVRQVCSLAPNNVNTMAAAAIAAHNLGFDKVQGCLVSDPSLTDSHIVEVDVTGPCDASLGKPFTVRTVRNNPAQVGNVTGSATYASFLSSMLGAKDQGPGVHLC